MTDEAESQEDEVEVSEPGPQPIILDVPDGQYLIYDMDVMAEALGEYPAALLANDKGLFWLCSKCRWHNVEAEPAKVAAIRKN